MATIILAALSDTDTLQVWAGTDLLQWYPVTDEMDLGVVLAGMGFVQLTDWATAATQSGAGVLVAQVARSVR